MNIIKISLFIEERPIFYYYNMFSSTVKIRNTNNNNVDRTKLFKYISWCAV